MKNLVNLPFLFFLGILLTLGSCQKEDKEFIDETNNEETFTEGSNITALLRSASQNNGTMDNLIDGSDCFSVVFPIEVFANGQKLTLNSIDDIQLVREIFDQFPSDTDTLDIVFPIQVVTEDFTTIDVANANELASLVSNCTNSIIDTYACVDFVYPITCFIYNNNNEQTGSITLNNAHEWLDYLLYLETGIYIAIDYPMSVLVNGQTIVVNSNQELIDAISQADCSNDDGGGNTDPSDFENYLTTGVWYVTYFFDDYDETSDFVDYEFSFAVDGSAEATNATGSTPGTWDFYVDSGVDKVDLFFGTTSPLDEIDEDWEILEVTNDIIRLKHISGGDGSVDFLTYERTPYSGGGGNTNAFIENLVNGSWYVNLLDDDGNDETCDYVDYEFVYNINGSVTATSLSNTKNGFWTVTDSGSGLDLVLNFEIDNQDDPFEDLNDDWDITDYDAQLIQLMDVSGGNGGTDYLNFGREPHTGCGGGGGQDLNDILLNGPWYVATYLDDGDDETYDYYGYNLTFNSGGSVVAENGTNTFNGTWSVTGSSTPDLILDFGTQFPFDEFNDDWDVISYNETTVNLEDVSGGNGGTDTLIFQKL